MSPGLFRDAVDGYWRYAEGNVPDGFYGSSRLQELRKTTKPVDIYRRKFETRTTKHISESNRLRGPKCPKGPEENHGQPYARQPVFEIRSTKFFGDIADIFFFFSNFENDIL
jgi:hypothetical protein